ncbi:MAG: ribosome-binding factor A [Ectothiorhodospiraceae bacterium]|nr:ribosome-binding factor A [Ectothiorhodospiraceae bacterium]
MAKEFSRTRRVADQIQRHMAELIQMELGDPRVGMVTVTSVDVTHEFERARIYFTVLGTSMGGALGEKSAPSEVPTVNEQAKITAKVLNKAAGYLRTALARRLKLRTTPQLIFIYDSSMEQGNRLTDLINSAAASDAENDSDNGEPSTKTS